MKVFFTAAAIICNIALANIPSKSKRPSEFDNFAVALAQVKTFYIKDVPYDRLLTEAMRGMTRSLDPHSDYLTKKDLAELNKNIKGEYAGIGVYIIPEDGFIKVIAPLDNSPAKAAGIKSGDIIFKVNDKLVNDIGIDVALKNIQGKPGTKVKLATFTPESKKINNYNIIRKKMPVSPVEAKMLGDNILYIRVPMFNENTSKGIKTALAKFKYDGIIIDLRDNPGGLLSQAAESSDLFLDAKKLNKFNKRIVSVKGRVKEFDVELTAHDGDLANAKPIVIIINQGSASASEILSGALQNYHRAIVVGSQSFGKGSVQTVIPGNDFAVKITTALYHLPNDETIQAIGIQPDILVEQLDVTPKKKSLTDIITEASNINHIKNKNDSYDLKLNNKQINEIATKDFQLYQSAKILETVILARK